jgi:carbon-monoxide dehydrogenase small subunit
MMPITFRCNGKERQLHLAADRLLSDALREDLGLTGTKVGCGTGECGACTVLLGGDPVCACLVYAAECAGADVLTVEGVAETEAGRLLVAALDKAGAVQCGICSPGFVVSGVGLITSASQPLTREQIQEGLSGNLCRCTGYYPIISAVESASRSYGGGSS